MEKKSVGRPKGYRKPDRKKGKYFKLSGEEDFAIRQLLYRMRRKDIKELPYIKGFEYVSQSSEIIVLPDKLYSLDFDTHTNNLPDFQTFDITNETKLSYIIDYKNKLLKVSKKTLKACINGQEVSFYSSYKTAFCAFITEHSDLLTGFLYELPYNDFANTMRNIWKYDNIVMLEYLYRVKNSNGNKCQIDELEEF